jgi:tryptophan-rich sensory protein
MFFWAKMTTFAIFNAMAMLIFVLLNVILFNQNNPLSAYVLVPCLFWACTIVYLNVYVAINNPDPFFEIQKHKLMD